MAQMEDKNAIYEHAQLGHKLGFGKKPALIVVDFQLGFTVPEQSPLAGNLDAEVAATNELIAAARKKDIPVIFTVVGYDPHRQDDAGLWPEKAPSLRMLTLGSDLVKLDPRLRLLRHLSGLDLNHAVGRYRHRHRLHHERLCARNGDGCPGQRLSAHCAD